MKKILIFLCALLLGSACASAQYTTVTATVVDSDGTVWANAPYSFNFQPGYNESNPANYTYNGAALNAAHLSGSGTANGSGVISFSVYQSTLLKPIPSSYNLTVCPNASGKCATINFSTSSGSVSLSSQINAAIAAPRFQAVSGAYGYADTEAILKLIPGSTYWNVTTSSQRCYTGSTWGACGSGGGGNLSGTLTPNVYPVASGANTLIDGAIDQDITYPDYLTIQPSTGKSIQIISNGDTNGAAVIYACNDDETTCNWLDLESPASGNVSEFKFSSNTFQIDTPYPDGRIILGHGPGTYQFVVTDYGFQYRGYLPTSNVGTVITGSTNNTGGITLSGQTSVTLTFAGGGFDNGAFCTASPSVSLATVPYVSAVSKTAVTFTFPALTGSLYYTCIGN